MLHVGLDLSRRKVDVCLLSEQGEPLDQLAVPPDGDALRSLARRIEQTHREPVCAVIESMTGARFVHDTLERAGWAVEIADAQKVKGLAPLACKTDKIDSRVLATLSLRDLVPAIWLPDARVRGERELARFRLHLVKHKSALKCRVHSTLINFGKPCPVTDLFGVEGRRLLARLRVPEPWRGNITASVELIDDLERQIAELNRRLKQGHADHRYIPLLLSAPGIGWLERIQASFAIPQEETVQMPTGDPVLGSSRGHRQLLGDDLKNSDTSLGHAGDCSPAPGRRARRSPLRRRPTGSACATTAGLGVTYVPTHERPITWDICPEPRQERQTGRDLDPVLRQLRPTAATSSVSVPGHE